MKSKMYFLDFRASSIFGLFMALSFTDADMIMKITSFVIVTCYTLRRWYLLEKNKKE